MTNNNIIYDDDDDEMQIHEQITKTNQEIVIDESSWLPGENLGPLLLALYRPVTTSRNGNYEI